MTVGARRFDRVDKAEISDKEFQNFKLWIFKNAGIHLADHKKALVMGRLSPRLRHYQLSSYGQYYDLLTGEKSNPGETQIAIDLLTTNETYFFREPKHFDFLRDDILPVRERGRVFRVWSAAGSSGEEAYSIAMLLDSCMKNDPWEVVASDLSSRMLEKASTGLYPIARSEKIPKSLLHKYCLKGIEEQEGKFIINRYLRSRVKFRQINLVESIPDMGLFDVIFLRNVMIYFEKDTRDQVVKRLLPLLKVGGYFIVGHSESLNGIDVDLKVIKPSIYKKNS